ncbi:MAG: phosphoribosylformylglycinamidine synthase subunit PurL [Pseudomonadota bacterium]|nr:phosphoribosylformylglycinamidine synthase subunit PurL [Pseudomonadota bacterium]
MKRNNRDNRQDACKEIALALGLNLDEYRSVLNLLERTPSFTEIGIFSAMWNEHCSYKSSKKWLRKLPTAGDKVICGPGENAGIVDIGDNQAIVFKMESHNHPSFVEPFQGAATGVGGILRDIFTMGGRPIATMNSLSFGQVQNQKTLGIANGVVHGISSYGNSFGVPNVGGEIRFNKAYDGNCLVNVFAAGLVNKNNIFYSAAAGLGMPIAYLGAKTGRDGVGGASMASAEFSGGTDSKKPAVQVGDPFTEKCLMEACLELMDSESIISIQDMGAAGLTCSAVEMGDKGNLGIELYLEKVPTRESSMTAFDMMLSESQERMLFVLKPEKKKLAEKIAQKWDLAYAIIGKTIREDKFKVFFNGKIEADIPLQALSRSAPEYNRPWTRTPKQQKYNESVPYLNSMDCLKKLISSPNYCSREKVWQQYDHTILSNTLIGPGSDAALIRIENTNKALALTCDVTPRYCLANPLEGGKQAVAESFRNIIASGASPVAITDNLNFGNPERPEIMGQLVDCIKGITKASKKLNMPVVSGNVSLYNETNGNSILPTPTIGAIGILDDYKKRLDIKPGKGDILILIGDNGHNLGRSAFEEEILKKQSGDAPPVFLTQEKELGKLILRANKMGLLSAAHDVSDGGIAIATAEMSIISGIGIKIVNKDLRWYFNEGQGRYVLACSQKNKENIMNLLSEYRIKNTIIGRVEGQFFALGKERISVKSLQKLYNSGFKNIFF